MLISLFIYNASICYSVRRQKQYDHVVAQTDEEKQAENHGHGKVYYKVNNDLVIC